MTTHSTRAAPAVLCVLLQDPFFQPMLGSLVKLVFLSSAVHQMVFAAGSSMPFAVGIFFWRCF